MGSLADRTIGLGLLIVTIVGYLYYTTWILITPFVDEGHFIHSLFLPREYAITIPLTLLVILLSIIFIFISLVMINTRK